MKSKDTAVKNGIYYTPKRIVKYTEKQIKKQVDRYKKGLKKESTKDQFKMELK